MKMNKFENIANSLLLLLFVYASVFLHIFLFLTNRSNESGQLKYIYIATFIISMLLLFSKTIKINKKQLIGAFILVIILALFYITKYTFGYYNEYFKSELLLYISIIVNMIFITSSLFQNNIEKINDKLIFWFDIISSLVILFAAIFTKQVTTGGLLSSNSGLIYQNVSYYAAFCFGLSIYLIQNCEYEKLKIKKATLFFLMIIQLFTCIIGGGRGGFALTAVLLLYMIFTITKNARKKIFYCVLILTLCVFVVKLAPVLSNKYSINITGLNRVLNIIDSRKVVDENRRILQNKSLEYFKQSPIVGNGLGSSFYLFNTYSHNCFTDILCETGIIGMIIFLFILINYILIVIKKFSNNSLTRLMFCIFICGFTMNLFSGYLIVNSMVLFPVYYELTNYKKKEL